MKSISVFGSLITFLFFLSPLAGATIWNILPDGSGDAPTIQAGIDSAALGDTVLVAPGLYPESVSFGGKDITVGSHFLLTGDPAEIDATVIDPPGYGSCVVFAGGETRQALLRGFTLTGGWGTWFVYDTAGGGVFVSNSHPTLEDLVITDCEGWGAGVFIVNGSPLLKRCRIQGNRSTGPISDGGGVHVEYGVGTEIEECLFLDNLARSHGGGVSLYNASVAIRNCEFRRNRSDNGGGLLVSASCNAQLTDNLFAGNRAKSGGGIFVYASGEIDLKGDCLTANHAQRGGGLYIWGGTTINFHDVVRCSIHGNLGLWGRDFYNTGDQVLAARVDTFSVPQPTAVHLFPTDLVTVEANVHRWSQVDADLFVAPDGDDAAAGTGPAEPLRTIQQAVARLAPISTAPRTIHLAAGLYSPSATGEVFPLALLGGVGLAGAGRESTRLDPEQTDAALVCGDPAGPAADIFVADLAITGAVNWGAIRCLGAGVELSRLLIRDNSDDWQYSSLSTSDIGNAGVLCDGGIVRLTEVDLIDNHVELRYSGGGLVCRDGTVVRLERVLLAGNTFDWDGGGMTVSSGSRVAAFNCTITGSSGDVNPAGIRFNGADHLALVNCICWDNEGPQVRMLGSIGTLLVAYTDLLGAEAGVLIEGSATLDWREGNLDADPEFVAPAAGDFSLGTDSPCIDSGTAHFEWGDPLFVLDLDPGDYSGEAPDMGAREFLTATAVSSGGAPAGARLGPAYPNPANPRITVPFSLPAAGPAELVIFDLKGRRVRTLLGGTVAAGAGEVIWDGRDDSGLAVAAGIYICRLVGGERVATRRLVLVR